MNDRSEGLALVAAGISTASCRRPALRDALVARDHLVKRLLDVDRHDVVIVDAPPAYGKSTTLALWDVADERSFAWVHLSRLDNDPSHLLRHVAVAVAPPATLPATLTRTLTGPGSSPLLDMAPAVATLLGSLEPTVLVFDDVHDVSSREALRCLEALLAVPIDNCQLVFSGRSHPHIYLGRTIMSAGLSILAADDLAMDVATAREFFQRSGRELAPALVDELVQKTEGWPGGLHLAELAMSQTGREPGAWIVSHDDGYLKDYLVEEVIRTQSSWVVDFLERSAVLDEMTPSLLDELLERDDSAEFLTSVEQSGNLFLVPLDPGGERYRYHGLFAQTLRGRLRQREPDLYRRLQSRASSMFERRADIGAAIDHAVAADEQARAADLVLRSMLPLTMLGRLGLLRTLLDALGPDTLETNVAAALASSWYSLITGDAEGYKSAYAAAERLDDGRPLADGSPSAEVVLAVMRAFAGWSGCPGVIADAGIAREAGDGADNPWWAVATQLQGTAHSMIGELPSARERFLEVLRVAHDSPAVEVSVRAQLGILALYEDDLAEAERCATHAARLMDRHNLEGFLPSIQTHPLCAAVSAAVGRHDEAREFIRSGARKLARLDYFSPRSALLGNYLLAKAAVALGDPAQAREFAKEAEGARRTDRSAVYLNERLDELNAQLSGESAVEPAWIVPLTSAQVRVLTYFPTHLSLPEIAQELYISRNTVKSHCVAIYRKLGVASRGEAVAEARRLGILRN